MLLLPEAYMQHQQAGFWQQQSTAAACSQFAPISQLQCCSLRHPQLCPNSSPLARTMSDSVRAMVLSSAG